MLNSLWREIHQSYFLVVAAVGVVVGIILGLVLRIDFFISPIWILFAGSVLVLVYLKPKIAFVVAALVVGMVLAFFRISGELTEESYVRQLYGQKILVTGVIVGDPQTDESGTKFKLSELKFGDGMGRAVGGDLYISEYRNEELARGDRITLGGKLAEGFGTYVGYMYRPTIAKWERPEPGDLVLKIRNWFAGRVKGLILETESALGLSYLLGMKSGLPDDLDENLRTVGLVHIVVASGAHLSILVEIAKKIFGKLSRAAGLLFSILFILFFMAMVGFTPSILRAGIMSILTIGAWYVGRRFEPWRIILIVAAMTLMMNPMFIIDLGWLLSFASFGGIMILGPKLTKFFYGEKKPGFVAETIITTIAATLMTLPIVLYYYGQISLISVVANLLILPTLPYAMGLVFLTGVCAGVPFLETMVAWCTTRLLDFHIAVVEWFAEMKQFLVKIEPYQAWVWGIYIVIIGLLVWLAWRRIGWWTNGVRSDRIDKIDIS